MNNLISRWNSESPLFFKWLINFGVGLASLGTTLLALSQIQGFTTSFPFAQYASYILIGGTILSTLSKLTVKN